MSEKSCVGRGDQGTGRVPCPQVLLTPAEHRAIGGDWDGDSLRGDRISSTGTAAGDLTQLAEFRLD